MPIDLESACADARGGNAAALAMVRVTLEPMADGGIYDQLGGGFYRYSVDGQWPIPHFEKMLYDNGPLLALYADLARVTGDRCFADVARGIVAWMDAGIDHGGRGLLLGPRRGLRARGGQVLRLVGAAWRAALLTTEEFAVARPTTAWTPPPTSRSTRGTLRARRAPGPGRRALGIPLEGARPGWSGPALVARRAGARIRPGRDDKMLTGWNALAVAGLARATRARRAPWPTSPARRRRAKRHGWRDGRLFATQHGDARRATASSTTPRSCSTRCTNCSRRGMARPTSLGARSPTCCWRSSRTRTRRLLLHQPRSRDADPPAKPGHDNATPSGNGVAAQALIALGHLAGVPRYVAAGERAVHCCTAAAPTAAGFRVAADGDKRRRAPPATVLLAGAAEFARNGRRRSSATTGRRAGVLPSPGGPAARSPRVPPARGAAAWICRGTHCLPPVATLEEIVAALGG